MHHESLDEWTHAHTFGREVRRPAEARALTVVGLTAVTMFVEIAAGLLFGSMALLADGLHMGSHAVALAINAFAYVYARRHADDPRYSFGTGKIDALGGFTGAILLATLATFMGWESVQRLVSPAAIAFNQALIVAVLGLLVNGVSVFILDVRRGRRVHAHEGDDHHEDRDHGAAGHTHAAVNAHEHDHNLRSAYLHVLADALTSVLAIGALLAAKYFGMRWADPAVGILGAVLIARWSVGLLRASSAVLLDRQASSEYREAITSSIESDGDGRVADLHVWSIGPNTYAAIIRVVAGRPATPEEYRDRLPESLGLAHVSIEVCRCDSGPVPDTAGD